MEVGGKGPLHTQGKKKDPLARYRMLRSSNMQRFNFDKDTAMFTINL
jgi:hypothetical protein